MNFHPDESITLESRNLVKRYRKRVVVNEVSIRVNQGEIVGLLGPNGAGKTTTFYMFTGIVRPNKGKVYLNNEDITRKPMYQRARMGIGYLSQEPSVFRNLTVRQNLESIVEFLSLKQSEIRERADRLIEEFGLQKVAKNKGDRASGGEGRRPGIARALVAEIGRARV